MAPSPPVKPEPPLSAREWWIAAAMGLVGIGLTAYGVRHAELITGRYITTGVPPVPAVAALLLLVGVRALARRLPGKLPARFAPDRRQILIVFSMVCIGAVLNGQ